MPFGNCAPSRPQVGRFAKKTCGAGRARVRRKSVAKAPKSPRGDVVGPRGSADMSIATLFRPAEWLSERNAAGLCPLVIFRKALASGSRLPPLPALAVVRPEACSRPDARPKPGELLAAPVDTREPRSMQPQRNAPSPGARRPEPEACLVHREAVEQPRASGGHQVLLPAAAARVRGVP